MKYKILSTDFSELWDKVKTTDGDTLYIVSRNGEYAIRRTNNNNGSFEWDLSKTRYKDIEEAKRALLSGEIPFKIVG